MRLKIIRVIFSLGFALLVVTLFFHQVIQGDYYRALSKNNRIRVVPLEARRGAIYDRNGYLLAESRLSYGVLGIPQDIENIDELTGFLGRVLGADPAGLRRTWQSRKLNPFTPVLFADNLTREQIFAIEEERFRFPGVWIEKGYQRRYALGQAAAHVLGYVGKISVSEREQLKEYGISQLSVTGKDGVEKFYDRELGGSGGGLQMEVNSRGEQVRLLGVRDANPGEDITLTIDARLQSFAAHILIGRAGAAIVMDNDNGEILAMASAPAFDPNDFTDRSRGGNISHVFSNPQAPLFNRAVRGRFPPGSVFKTLMATAALNEGVIDSGKTFFCAGSYPLGTRTFGCTHHHGDQNVTESLAHSCNVYYYHLAQLMKSDQIHHYAQMFGLGFPTGIDLPYEDSGFVPSSWKKSPAGHEAWTQGDMLNYAIGQGNLLATPLQMVNMMASVARHGIVVRPHVIKSVGAAEIKKFLTEERIPISSAIFDIIHQGLKAAVESNSGTAHGLDIDGLTTAGKTGTAQSSGNKASHAWFVGYARSDVRNIAFCVVLEHGGSSVNAVVLSRELLLEMKRLGLI